MNVTLAVTKVNTLYADKRDDCIRPKNENPSFLRKQEPLSLTPLDSGFRRNDEFPRFQMRLPGADKRNDCKVVEVNPTRLPWAC